MKISRIISLIACGLISVVLSGCGDSFELQSISLDPTHPNLVGIGGTAQFTVTAHYSNNKTADVTRKSTYQITASPKGPLSAVTINANGLAEAIDGACTWTWTGTAPNYLYGTDPYPLNVSFEGKTVQGFISVASIAGCFSPDTPPPAS